ncbi:TonB-dependent receptor [Roseateles toxinivorans]|uniref:Iron complex outermembrane receptor protein n=1 Tax=Roseateles toxinivorans TaxID=270368 RepID=A0A4V3CTH1_9BURK|nr:TonB-dependent receptor [Roseateles toxinivorans]TDP72324.1 iron complex outermembrane receptor protein [Roseateles toxinivorans]
MRQVPATLTTLLLVSAISAAYAQQAAPAPAAAASVPEAGNSDAKRLETTIVTGTRTAKSIDKIPGAITVVSKEDLAHTLAVTEDASAVLARIVPGYAESSQAMSNTGETLRGRIPLRLFDGVPQGSPLREGGRSATFTDMGVIGRIEVINGPSASEGVGAAGGIINYISKVPTKQGDEFTLVGRVSSQNGNDSQNFKLGGTFARKAEAYDLLISAAHSDRGITYDGHGRRIGMNTSGSLSDSRTNDLFLKVGVDFGVDKQQRLQFSMSNFKVTGKGNYILVDGDRATGVTNTSERGRPLGAKTEFNDFEQYIVSYRHDNLFGGTFTADAYLAKQAMRYPAEDGADRQDPLIAPLGTLIDQSEIYAKKKGLRTAWTRPDIFAVEGLELRAGLDVIEDEAQQRLALTDRLWVPPMLYQSTAPYAQLSYDIGPLTLSGGLRREDGKLSVDTYTTTYFRNRVQVLGGSLKYNANLGNVGAVLKLPNNWSMFVAQSKGFSLPNIGIPLRNINKPGQSVDGILELQPILVKNKELGANWRTAAASFGASFYQSDSNLGVSLSVDPVTNDFIMNRAPVRIQGMELTGELNLSKELKTTALYSRIRGKTTFVANGPMDKSLGVNDVNPDKFGMSATWKYMANADVTLGFTKLMSRHINAGTGSEENTTGYTLFDLDTNYDFGRYGKLTLGVENLANKFYVLSWSQVPGFRNYWAGRGRVVTVTHTLTF